MIDCTKTIQINSVWPGKFGGAVFTGKPLNAKKHLTCRASWKVLAQAPKTGEFWEVHGRLVTDDIYGKQLIVERCHLKQLPSPMFLLDYLSKSPRFRGFYFGAKKTRQLISTVGSESLLIELLNGDRWQDLGDVINPGIAKRLCQKWREAQNEIETITFLVEHGFDAEISRRLIRLCQENTVERLKNNPYHLLAFGGISKNIWKTVDTCGRNLNFPLDDSRRLVGAIEHVMYQRLREGHTAATEHEVLDMAARILRTDNRAAMALKLALKEQAICITDLYGERLYQAVGPAYIEHSLERRLERLVGGAMQGCLFEITPESASRIVFEYSKGIWQELGYELTVDQRSAVEMALTNRCSVITGYGGTGKTTVLRSVVELSVANHRRVYCMALSGKAKERISESTGQSATTIHAFINAALKVTKGEDTWVDLDCDPLIVIDEASMVDVSLFNRLLAVFDERSFSLLTVGDDAQLSPVGFGLAWHRMIGTTIPTIKLSKVYRQAEESALHRAAMGIRDGNCEELPMWQGEEEGVFFVPANTETLKQTIYQLKEKIPGAQVLTPHVSDRMPDSAIALNKLLQKSLDHGEDDYERPGFRVGRYFLRVGDPVIVTENNYELGLFNGTMGRMLELKSNDGELEGVFEFDSKDENESLSVQDCYDIGLSLAYAISIHKSQGSEFDKTIMTTTVASKLVERSMIYTGLTRSKRLCLLVGDKSIYQKAVTSPTRAATLRVGFSLQ